MARLCKLILVLSLLLGAPAVAHAAIITINPNDYPFGTDLSTIFEGLTINQIEGQRPPEGFLSGTFTPGTSTPATIMQSPDPTLRSLGRGYIDSQSFSAVELLFDIPTRYLDMYFVWQSDTPVVYAYNPLGQLLSSTIVTGQYGGVSYSHLTLDHQQSDMARVVYGGVEGNSWLTGLSYDAPTAVPEPSTLLFVSMGAGLGLIRMRKRPQGCPGPSRSTTL